MRAASAWSGERHSAERCAALLRAIATHDEIALGATLPARLHLDYEPPLLDQSYRLSLQLWEAVDRRALAALATALLRRGRFTEAEAQAFRDARARAKQLRFAHVLLDARHRLPRGLDRLTRLMGQAQDAARGGRAMRARARAALLRLLLARPVWAAQAREVRRFVPTGATALRHHLATELGMVRHALAGGHVTNKRFHDMRKVVSRLVAFYDTLTVLAPSAYHTAVDRYLSTINGLMGSAHDRMAERRIADGRGYYRVPEPITPPIASRLEALAAAFARAGVAGPLPSP